MGVTGPSAIAMKSTQLITIAVVGTLLIAGAAGLGAASPAEVTSQNPTTDDDHPASNHENASNVSDSANVNSTAETQAANAPGPVGELPDPVPNHVAEIHESVNEFLTGGIEYLGEAVSSTASGENGQADTTAANASASDAVTNETDEQSTNTTSVGPDDGLPSQAADRAHHVHDTIEAYLNGAVDSLGSLLGNAETADENALQH